MDIFTSNNLQILIQLLLAVILAGLIGFERQRAQKSAGLRTYGLVGLGSCVLTIISTNAFDNFIGLTSFDPSRIISNIVISIGFIGAGLIFHQGLKIEGLTTATGLWVVAIIGMAVGMQLYFLAITGTLISFILIGILGKLNLD